MNWSVHQYQTPRIGAPKRIPVQGKFGSLAGFHRERKSGPTDWISMSQPPSAASPATVTVTAPPMSTNSWSRSVYSTAVSPPKMV
jgi:hypothetical protein